MLNTPATCWFGVCLGIALLIIAILGIRHNHVLDLKQKDQEIDTLRNELNLCRRAKISDACPKCGSYFIPNTDPARDLGGFE